MLPFSELAGGRTFSLTPASARPCSISPPAIRARRTSAPPSPRNTIARRPTATRLFSPIPQSRRSSIRRRTTSILRPRSRPRKPANTCSSTSPSPTPWRKAWRSRKSAPRRALCWRSAISAAAKATSAGSRMKSTPAASASWCRRKPISAATVSARSTFHRGVISQPVCRGA